MRSLADELGGDFLDNPLWYLQRVITVHPLGGAPMGRTPDEGVVDPYGRGVRLPGPPRRRRLGDARARSAPNPRLTIAALADRFADRILEEHRR